MNSNEKTFLGDLEEYSQNLKEIIDDYGNTYQTYYEYKSQDLLEDYVAQYGDAANLTGRELENWKNGLYETADGNAALEESLESLINKVYQFNEAETELSLSGTGISENLSESLQTSLSKYEDKISDFLSEKDKIDSALKEQEENGSISASTAFELSKLGYKSAVLAEILPFSSCSFKAESILSFSDKKSDILSSYSERAFLASSETLSKFKIVVLLGTLDVSL